MNVITFYVLLMYWLFHRARMDRIVGFVTEMWDKGLYEKYGVTHIIVGVNGLTITGDKSSNVHEAMQLTRHVLRMSGILSRGKYLGWG